MIIKTTEEIWFDCQDEDKSLELLNEKWISVKNVREAIINLSWDERGDGYLLLESKRLLEVLGIEEE